MEVEREDIEFAEKHRLTRTAESMQRNREYSFIIKELLKEAEVERVLLWIFKEGNTRLAYYLIKYADLTSSQEVNIILFLMQKGDFLRLIDIVKEDLVSGGILSIIVEMVDDFSTLYHVAIYANRKKLDVGIRNVLVNKVVQKATQNERKKFLQDVNWLTEEHKNKL